MAKKSRRVQRKGAKPRLSEAQLVRPTEAVIKEVVPTATAETASPVQRPTETDFRSEYHYVVRDLQRIALLAAAMLGGLLILSFVV